MDVPTDLCSDSGDSFELDFCQSQKHGICSLPFDTNPLETPTSSRRPRPLSDFLASLRDSPTAMQSYRLSAHLLADEGLGLEADFFQSWLDYNEEAPQEKFAKADAISNVASKSNDPPNPLLFALSKPKKVLNLPPDETGSGSFSSDETEAGIASSSLHGDSPRKDGFQIRDKDQAWTSNPFDDELNMIETMIAEDRSSKLPPSAATAGWTQGAEKRESAHHYAKIQVPHRSSKAPKLPVKELRNSEEFDFSLGDFDYSQFHQPPARPALPPKDSILPRAEISSGPIVIKTSRETFNPRPKVDKLTATSRSMPVERVQSSLPKPLISFNEQAVKPLTSFNEQSIPVLQSNDSVKVVGKVTSEKYLPSHPLTQSAEKSPKALNDEPLNVNGSDQVYEAVNAGTDSTLPKLGLPILDSLASSTKMPGSWSLSESSASPTLSEPADDSSRGFGFNRLREVLFPSTISTSYGRKPTLEKKRSLGNLFSVATKHGLKKEKDFFKSRPKVARQSIVMPSISLQEHFKARNTPVIVMKKRPPPTRTPKPIQKSDQSISLQDHFKARNTPITIVDSSSNATVPSPDQSAATYPRKVVRKPSQRH